MPARAFSLGETYCASDDDPFAVQLPLELTRELPLVLMLHHENDLGPLNEFGRQRVFCVAIRASRRALKTRAVGERLLSRWTAQPILAANEQNSGQVAVDSESSILRQRQSVLLNKAVRAVQRRNVFSNPSKAMRIVWLACAEFGPGRWLRAGRGVFKRRHAGSVAGAQRSSMGACISKLNSTTA